MNNSTILLLSAAAVLSSCNPSVPPTAPLAERPGIVVNPFTNKPIDVIDIKAGELVRDPNTGHEFYVPRDDRKTVSEIAHEYATNPNMTIEEMKKQVKQAYHEHDVNWSDYEGQWKDLDSKNIWMIYPQGSVALSHGAILYFADHPQSGVGFSITNSSSLLLKEEVGQAGLWKGGKKSKISPLKGSSTRINISSQSGIIRLQKVSGLPKSFLQQQEQELDGSVW